MICLGYKGYAIMEYSADYFLHNSGVAFDVQSRAMEVHGNTVEPWRVTLVDTAGLRLHRDGVLSGVDDADVLTIAGAIAAAGLEVVEVSKTSNDFPLHHCGAAGTQGRAGDRLVGRTRRPLAGDQPPCRSSASSPTSGTLRR